MSGFWAGMMSQPTGRTGETVRTKNAKSQCACPAGPKHPRRCPAKVLLSGTRCAICRRECPQP